MTAGRKVTRWLAWALCMATVLSGCKSSRKAESTVDRTVAEIISGNVVGGTAGAVISRKMAVQKVELDSILPQARPVETFRKGEVLKVTLDAGLMFIRNASTLSDTARHVLYRMTSVLTRYPDTDLRIIGYTDSTGQLEFNRKLSERRAGSVRDYLASQGIAAERMSFRGEGVARPVADNGTEEGRARNRRVEIWLLAGERMIREAQQTAEK